MILPFRTFDANGIILVRSAGIFHKRVLKIFTLLTDHLTYGHHFNLSESSRATMEQFHRCARVYILKKTGAKGSGRAVSPWQVSGVDQRSAKSRQCVPCTYPVCHGAARETKGAHSRSSRISRRDQNINYAQHPYNMSYYLPRPSVPLLSIHHHHCLQRSLGRDTKPGRSYLDEP